MNHSNHSDEIDIIQFFAAIGQMFSNFFKAIINLFVRLFYLIADILLYMRKYWLFLTGGILVGLVWAFFTHQPQNIYYNQANIRANYEAQMALKEKLDLINDLIQHHKTSEIAQVMSIDTALAGHLVKMEMEPVQYDHFLWQDYQDFLIYSDTLFYKYLKFKDYKANIKQNPELNRYWKIKVYADNRRAFKTMSNNILYLIKTDSSIIDRKNDYLTSLKLHRKKMLKSLKEVDSLRNLYNTVLLKTSEYKSTLASNILINTDKLTGTEIPYDLFKKRQTILNDLENITLKINRFDKALIYLNRFSQSGTRYSSIWLSKYFKYPFLGFLLVLAGLLLKDFNTFLTRYQRQKTIKQD